MPVHFSMPTTDLVAEVKSLKAKGYSIRRIAARLMTSHGTVSRILKGHIPGEKDKAYQDSRRQKVVDRLLLQERLPRPINPNSEKFDNQQDRVKYIRCGGCGGMVQAGVPCLACETKKQMAGSFDCYLADLLTPCSSYPIPGMKLVALDATGKSSGV